MSICLFLVVPAKFFETIFSLFPFVVIAIFRGQLFIFLVYSNSLDVSIIVLSVLNQLRVRALKGNTSTFISYLIPGFILWNVFPRICCECIKKM